MKPEYQILESLSREDLIDLLTKVLNQGDGTEIIGLQELCRRHYEHVKSKEFSENTLQCYENAYRYLQQYAQLKGLKYANQFTYDHTNGYYNFLLNHKRFNKRGKLAKSYIISIYKRTKAVFAYAERRGYVAKNRFENKVYPGSQVTEWWTDEYLEKLCEAIREHAPHRVRFKTELKARLTYTTGLRPGIIHRIRCKDVIFKGSMIYVDTKCKVPKSAAIQRVIMPILNKRVKQMLSDYVVKLVPPQPI